MDAPLSYSLVDGVATLTMDDGKANALGFSMIEAVSDALTRAAGEAEVTVIQGRPGMLSAGFDLKVIQGDPSGVRDLVSAGARLLMQAYLHPQPLLAVASGHAVAAGALLMLTADYRIGVEGDFRIGLNETAIGLSLPGFALELVDARLSRPLLARATVGAELFAPDKAIEAGYLDATVSADALAEAVASQVASLRALDKGAVAQVKQRFRGPAAERAPAEFAPA